MYGNPRLPLSAGTTSIEVIANRLCSLVSGFRDRPNPTRRKKITPKTHGTNLNHEKTVFVFRDAMYRAPAIMDPKSKTRGTPSISVHIAASMMPNATSSKNVFHFQVNVKSLEDSGDIGAFSTQAYRRLIGMSSMLLPFVKAK